MTIGRTVVAMLTVAAMAAAHPPAATAQQERVASSVRPAAQDNRAADVQARREELLRRREALRQRQEDLRRARQAARRGPMATDTFARTVRIGRNGTFTLTNVAGTVTVSGSGGDEVRIEATRRAWATTDADAKAALAQVEIDVTEREGTVDVRTVRPRPRTSESEVDFTISLPAGTNVSLRVATGDVTVSAINGELRAESVSGAIRASQVKQLRFLRTLGGDIQVDDAESTDVTVSTLGGAVAIRQLKARVADVRTVSGDLMLAGSDSERVTAQSLTGRVELAGRLARTGRYNLQSQSGDVRLMPNDDGFELEAATVNGTVRCDFPLTLEERRAPASSIERTERLAPRGGRLGGSARVLRGLSGDGGPLVTLRSFSGDITIARR